MSGKMSMASRLGCPAERRRVVTVHTYRPIGMCPNTIQIPTISYHDHSEDEPGFFSGIGILLRKWQKLQLYSWLTNPQVASVVFQLKRHPTYTVGKRDCLSLAQEKILSNQITDIPLKQHSTNRSFLQESRSRSIGHEKLWNSHG